MDGEGVHAVVVFKDEGGAVALVKIAIDNRNSEALVLFFQFADGYRHVVDIAKSLGMVRKGVVKAAGEVDGTIFL